MTANDMHGTARDDASDPARLCAMLNARIATMNAAAADIAAIVVELDGHEVDIPDAVRDLALFLPLEVRMPVSAADTMAEHLLSLRTW